MHFQAGCAPFLSPSFQIWSAKVISHEKAGGRIPPSSGCPEARLKSNLSKLFKLLHRFPGIFYATHPSEAAVDSTFHRAQTAALSHSSRNLQRQTHVSCWVDLVWLSNGGHASSDYQTSENRGVISIKSVSFRFCVMLELEQWIKPDWGKTTEGRHRGSEGRCLLSDALESQADYFPFSLMEVTVTLPSGSRWL